METNEKWYNVGICPICNWNTYGLSDYKLEIYDKFTGYCNHCGYKGDSVCYTSKPYNLDKKDEK